MQFNSQSPISTNHNLINQNFLPDDQNSTSTKTFKQFPIKSPPTSSRMISPLTQMMQIKNIKNDQFLFRMKLKFIACMQQLEISKQDIETLRKQESDADVLSSFITPIKKEFSGLKKIKDEYLLKQNKNHSSMKTTNSLQSLEIISLQSQLQQISESQRKLKHRCQRLFTQNAQLVEKLKKKQHEFQQSENSLYQTKLLLKEYESVIENLKMSAKKIQKDFLSEKDRLNEELNAFKELMVRQRQAKQIYSSKMDYLQTSLLEKEDQIKRVRDQGDFLKKQCIKWKNRSQWRQNEASQETRLNDQKLKSLQQQIQKLSDTIKAKDSQLIIAKKQASSSTEVFNKKLQNIVEQWKGKLIETIEEYEGTVEGYQEKLGQNQKELQRMNQLERQVEALMVQNDKLMHELSNAKINIDSKDQKIVTLQGQLKDTLTFYTQKVRQLESIISQLKSQNLSKSISIDHSMSSLSQLGLHVKETQTENEKLKNQLASRDNELRKINLAKKDTQNQLLKRISTAQNNRIIEISKLKVQHEEKLNDLEKQLKKVKVELEKYKNQQIRLSAKSEANLGREQTQNIQPSQKFHQEQNMKSSTPSVNNSFNMGLGNDRVNDRTNRLISQTYVEPQKKSSVRRIFVRSNSINEYLKDKMASSANQQAKDKLQSIPTGFSFSQKSPSNVQTTVKNSGQQE